MTGSFRCGGVFHLVSVAHDERMISKKRKMIDFFMLNVV